MAVYGDDADEWFRCALVEGDLAARVLISFRQTNISWIPWNCGSDRDLETSEAVVTRKPLDSGMQDADDDGRPSTSARATELPEWGRRIKRSRMVQLDGIREAAAETRREKARASPQSPLVNYSSASLSGASGDGEAGTSSAETMVIVPKSLDASAAVVADGLGGSPMKEVDDKQHVMPGLTIAGQRFIGCLATTKATTADLHVAEKSLLEEKGKMQKELEELRRAAEKLKDANRELQLRLEKQKEPNTDGNVATVKDFQHPVPPLPISDLSVGKNFILPDLNELPEFSDY